MGCIVCTSPGDNKQKCSTNPNNLRNPLNLFPWFLFILPFATKSQTILFGFLCRLWIHRCRSSSAICEAGTNYRNQVSSFFMKECLHHVETFSFSFRSTIVFPPSNCAAELLFLACVFAVCTIAGKVRIQTIFHRTYTPQQYSVV